MDAVTDDGADAMGETKPGARPRLPDGISPDEVVAGRRILPPGYVEPLPEREYSNPYMKRIGEYPDQIVGGPGVEALRGRWAASFPSPGPLEVEIGSGNGFFLRGLCLRHPQRCFLGIEVRYKRVWISARKLHVSGCTNGRVVLYHAGYLPRLFEPGEVAAFHLNHPDPWPKGRHARNRLINPQFCATLAGLLPVGGTFTVKSDCMRYVAELRRGFGPLAMEEEAFTADLHRPGEPLAADNILTNYERKFLQRGLPVFLMRLRRTG